MAMAITTEPTWAELLGSNNWEGLLDPLDLNLRHLVLRCGNFVQATYDAFNNDLNSKYAGSSRYGKKCFFEKVMLDSASDYQVEGFLYATAKIDASKGLLLQSLSHDAWDMESNFMGYVAVTTDEVSRALGRREIYVVWRGTSRSYEWVNNFEATPVSVDPLLNETQEKAPTSGPISNFFNGLGDAIENFGDPKVMDGWLTIYTSDNPDSEFTKLSARQQLHAKIKELRSKYQNENVSIIVTGHSLGAAIAVLSAFDIVENLANDIPNVFAIPFSGPRVGDRNFDERLKSYPNLKILRVKNILDVVPQVPPLLLGYVDSGVELVVDTRKSPFLKGSVDPSDWHNAEALLHVVAGWGGDTGAFELKVPRSLALVNKSCGFLIDELQVPESWWVEKNKGMVRDHKTGEWVLAPPPDEDKPVPEY